MNNDVSLELIDNKQVARITLNKTSNYNAFNLTTILQLNNCINKANANKHVKLIVIQANGKHFSSGADLKWMQQAVHYSKNQNIADAKQLATMLLNLYNSNKLIICAIEGNVYGGAIGIVACSDIVLATTNVKFCFAEVKLGLAPAIISQFVLKVMNNNIAKYYMLTAKTFTARQALQAGLVNKVIKINTLQQSIAEHVELLLTLDQTGIGTTKKLVKQHMGAISAKALHNCAKTTAQLRRSATCQKLIKYFLNSK